MTKFFFISTSLAATAAIVILSCTEPFDIETNNSSPVIAIYGTLTNDTAYHFVQVTVSSPYFDTARNPPVSGAEVSLSFDDKVLSYIETDAHGVYRTADSVAGTPGTTYTLRVKTDFNGDGTPELYEAVSTMPELCSPDSIQVRNMKIMGRSLHGVYLYVQDSPAKDFYLIRYKINDSAIHNRISRYTITDDQGFNGEYINGIMVNSFSDISEKEKDEFNNSEERQPEYARVYVQAGDTLTFGISRIEKGYFDFIQQCKRERNGENPFFGGPPSNIITNLTNGAAGYFASHAYGRYTAIVQ
jgi:hypothetical protein